MAIPDYQALMLPLLKLAASGQIRVLEAEKKAGEELGLTPEERAQLLPSGKQRVLHNRAHWAKFYLMKAGLVSFPSRGIFVATDAGRALLATNPPKIDLDLLKKYPSFVEFYEGSASDHPPPPPGPPPSLPASTPEEQIDKAFGTIQSALRTELLERVLKKSPSFFEDLIIHLFVKMGYGGSRLDAAENLSGPGDGGVDGVINEDRLGLDRIYLQAKRYSEGNVVGRPEIQKFLGSLVGRGATKGVFVTTSKFSGEAIEFAHHLSQRVILIDGNKMADLMIEYGIGCTIKTTMELKQVDENFFDEEE